MEGLNSKFVSLVIRLQDLNKLHCGDMPEIIITKIDLIGQKIQNGGLIDKCENKDFAKQLMNKNNVPDKYWK